MVEEMKKVIILIIILMFLTGCGYGGLFNLNNFILPNDIEFLKLIKELDTPEKICQYMLDNFESEEHSYITLTPYQLYLNKKGDCDDCSNFGIYIAHYHRYETYQFLMLFSGNIWHSIAVYKEGNCYTFSDNQIYSGGCYLSFDDILQIYNGWIKYKIYDYEMNIVETEYNN